MRTQRDQRAALRKLLYEMLADLEEKPRKDIGFPFNLLINLVQQALNMLEAIVSSQVVAFEAWIKPKAEPFQALFRRKPRPGSTNR